MRPRQLLLLKNRDHASPAPHHISITRATEPRLLGTRVGIGLHKHFLGAQLRGAVQVDRVDGFIGAQSKNPPHALIDGSINHVAPTDDVGLNGLEWVVFAGWHLLQRGRVNHNRNSSKSPLQAPRISHIAQEVSQAGMIQSRGAHVVLLKFIAAEDHQALWPVLLQHDLDKFLPERPGPARHQNCLFRPIHPIRLFTP